MILLFDELFPEMEERLSRVFALKGQEFAACRVTVLLLSGAGGQVPERNLVEGITANGKKCRQHAQSTLALATARNPYIGYANNRS